MGETFGRGVSRKAAWVMFGVLVTTSGCAGLRDIPRKIWGSSTTTLERARTRARRANFTVSPEGCFDEVLKLTHPMNEAASPSSPLELFLKDRRRRIIVVMGVPGNIDTTEAGIFFVPLPEGGTRVEVSSLSSQARDTVADLVFERLREGNGDR